MTVETTTSRVSYTGSGTTGPFTISFYFINNADIVAIKRTIADGTEETLTLTTDYTLSGAGDASGGTLTLVSALTSSYELIIYRDPDILQESAFPRNDKFPAATNERVLDKLTMIAQRIRNLLDRALRLPDGDTTGVDMTLPAATAAARGDKVVGFNTAGTSLELKGAVDNTLLAAQLASTASGNGAALVGFLQYGSGPIAGTVQGKNQITKHLWDFLTDAQRTDVLAGTGSVDIAAAVTAAHANLSALGGGTLLLGFGQALLNSSVTLKDKVSMKGDGLEAFIFDFRGTGQAFVANEAVTRTDYLDFQITNASNTNSNAEAMVWNYGYSRGTCRVKYTAKSADTADGFVVHGTENDDGTTANNNQYGVTWEVVTTAGTEVTGTALKLNGKDVANARCNAHNITPRSVLDGFSTALYINGNGNNISPTVNTASVAAIHLYGNDTNGNIINGSYLDTGISGDKLRLESTTARQVMCQIVDGVASLTPSTIVDASGGGNSATYMLLGRRYIIMPIPGGADSVDPDNGNTVLIGGNDPTDMFNVVAAFENAPGRIVLSGSTFDGGINAVSDRGGASAVIQDHGAAAFRVVKTANGSSYTKIFEQAQDGGISSLTSPANKSITAVDDTDNELDITSHGLVTGQKVVFRQTGGGDPGGLTSGTRYFIIVVNANAVSLATTLANAIAGTEIDITTTGSGTMILVTGGPVGSFTLAASASTTIDNAAVTASSRIFFTPTNAAARSLQAGADLIGVSAKAAGSFTVTTAGGGSPGGTETFDYFVVN